MASTPKIIVVGGGLAGLSAVIKIAEMGAQVDLFSIVPGVYIPWRPPALGESEELPTSRGIFG